MAVTINHYDQFVEVMGDMAAGYTGYGTDSIRAALMTSTHSFTAANTLWSQVSANQIPTGNGYTQTTGAADGKALASVTSTQPAAGTWMFDAADVTWTASGGPIPLSGNCQHCVLFDDTLTTPLNGLMFNINFGATQSAGDGTNFVITWNANGITRIT
jgi:hypothetical protein